MCKIRAVQEYTWWIKKVSCCTVIDISKAIDKIPNVTLYIL